VITQVRAGPYTLRGVSVAGVYTSLQVPELDALLDVGVAMRPLAATGRIFLSHGHLDHLAGLAGTLNIRGLLGLAPAQIHLPAEIEGDVRALLRAHTALSRAELAAEFFPMMPGDERALGKGLFVRALRTHHTVPSLGYQFLRRVNKLRPEHQGRAPDEIARLRKEGAADLFEPHELLELAYATDTLARVLESEPSLLASRVLVLECTYVGDQRGVEEARRKFHLHLDELAALAPRFENEALVLMHFGQATAPDKTREALASRLPEGLRERVVVFAPAGDRWFD
jgi:ribonuclease Z